eukprot:1158133-Pelagomonas_calceolata.AAC.12
MLRSPSAPKSQHWHDALPLNSSDTVRAPCCCCCCCYCCSCSSHHLFPALLLLQLSFSSPAERTVSSHAVKSALCCSVAIYKSVTLQHESLVRGAIRLPGARRLETPRACLALGCIVIYTSERQGAVTKACAYQGLQLQVMRSCGHAVSMWPSRMTVAFDCGRYATGPP